MSTKEIAKRIIKSDCFKGIETAAANIMAWNIAKEIKEGQTLEENLEERLKKYDVPTFSERAKINIPVENMTINQKIAYYYRNEISTRQISIMLDKSYTRVKNVIKNLKNKDTI